MDFSRIDNRSIIGNLLRLPLRLLPSNAILPILSGCLRGKKWIVGSSIHGCWLGTYEYEKQAIFSRSISQKSTVFDIGGNVGFYTLLASKLVGSDGKVFVFEPLPRNLSFLRKHLELNRIKNVNVIDAALSDENGMVFFDPGPRGEMAHIASNGHLQVKTWTLDHLFEIGLIQLPDLIKMDIEGAEFDALRGAKSLLSVSHPTIFLATHGTTVHRECCTFLKSLGYQLSAIDGNPLDSSKEIIAIFTHE